MCVAVGVAWLVLGPSTWPCACACVTSVWCVCSAWQRDEHMVTCGSSEVCAAGDEACSVAVHVWRMTDHCLVYVQRAIASASLVHVSWLQH